MPSARTVRSSSPTWRTPVRRAGSHSRRPPLPLVRAVFGFPLRVGTVRLGALNLCTDRPGALTVDQHADALLMADVVARTLLAIQAAAPPGRIAAELEAASDFRFVVHQASGMVSVQLAISIAEALVRLRTYAFATDSSLTTVAEDVLAHRLRLE